MIHDTRKNMNFQIFSAPYSRIILTVSVVLMAASFAWTGSVDSARAQSPTPTYQMGDSYPGIGFPPGSSAVAVEGLGSLGCVFSQSSIESATVSWTAASQKVVTEITPQTACGTISQYESLLSGIKYYVESYGTNPGTYWGGFMLDEEGGYGFSATQLETLNAYVESIMVTAPGMSWYFQEDQPNSWNLSTYNAILGNSWPAGQAYSSSMVAAMNAECTTYSNCQNLVTVNSKFASPWNSPAYVTGIVNGTPWSISYWGSANWFNVWRNGN